MPGDDAPTPPRRELLIGLACAFATLAIWTGFILIARFGVRTSLAPADLVALRFGVSGLILAPWVLRHGLGLPFARALALALTAGLGFSFLAFSGFVFSTAAHGAALMPGTLPLWTVILAALVVGEKLTALKLLGVGLTVAGVAAIAIPELAGAGTGTLLGDLMFPAASLSWATYTVLSRRWGVAPVQSAAIVCVISGLLYVPAYLVVAGDRLLAAPLPDVLAQAVYQGVIATVISIFTYLRAVSALGAGPTSLITAAVPGVVTLVAIPVLGEWPGPATVIGVGLVSAGVVVTVLGLTRQAAAGYQLTRRESRA